MNLLIVLVISIFFILLIIDTPLVFYGFLAFIVLLIIK